MAACGRTATRSVQTGSVAGPWLSIDRSFALWQAWESFPRLPSCHDTTSAPVVGAERKGAGGTINGSLNRQPIPGADPSLGLELCHAILLFCKSRLCQFRHPPPQPTHTPANLALAQGFSSGKDPIDSAHRPPKTCRPSVVSMPRSRPRQSQTRFPKPSMLRPRYVLRRFLLILPVVLCRPSPSRAAQTAVEGVKPTPAGGLTRPHDLPPPMN